jgi:repressor LexA
MSINERFSQMISALYKGNKSAFASAIGVTPSVVDNIVGKRQGKPSFEVVEKVSALAELNIDWLITGKGNMLKEEETAIIPSNDGSGIPLIPVEAMAGCFTGSQTVLLQECDRYVVPAFKNADFLIRVSGDSMTPRYLSGDLVACKMLSLSDIFFQWGKVYVIDTEQGALIKKVEQGSTPNTITIVSENKEYKPFELPRTAIYHIAIVMGLIRTE